MRYFPSTYPKGKGPPRDYFFNVLNTLHPEYLTKIMAHKGPKEVLPVYLFDPRMYATTRRGSPCRRSAQGRKGLVSTHRIRGAPKLAQAR